MNNKTHIAIFPSPGVSHLIPFIEFTKRLLLLHNFHITCFILTTTDDYSAPSPAKKAILNSLPAAIDIIYLPPVSFDDLPKDSNPELKLTKFYLANGIIINSFAGIESEAIKALQANEGMVPIFPVGPIVQIGPTNTNGAEYCLSWLDKQPSRSVLYVSFGSGGTLSSDQMTELAFGLEMSGQKFIWVVRKPDNESPNAAYLKDGQSQFEATDVLPKGFLERTKGRGLVVQSWAPQTLVLSHGSTGGFLSHCGWSSTLESMVEGVPLIAWPLFAEQKMNAVMLVDGLEVALRPIEAENGIVGGDEIARVVKVVMDRSCEEGKKVRERMNEFKDAAAKALSHDGSSTRALSNLAFALRSKASN
ncbi:hypothetical protein G4B88_014825 [Cannabis sativa]|uniref:Glycosyltransferase n=1 Tax=Cannabis sativa TaxID=3483 RepID=A0A7J6IBH1_CANSA|nr:hypothetical protein G4B88_014825 [Cannabis sativa]